MSLTELTLSRALAALLFIFWSGSELGAFLLSINKKRDIGSLFFAISAGGMAVYYIIISTYAYLGINDLSFRSGFGYIIIILAFVGAIQSISRLNRRYYERNHLLDYIISNLPFSTLGAIPDSLEITQQIKQWQSESKTP